MQSHIVLVPHTHWDREWYRTHEEFRYRLVRLLDRLLEILEGDPGYRHFTLDGQTIVVDDYLAVRPEAAERIAKLVRDGRLSVGPWTVLPDEWLVSGEALIRNLRLGLRRAARLGGSMEVGYVPDQFGHVGQLPQILAGFGMRSAVLWRGVGADVDRTLFHWQAPDGTRLLTVYLMQGYGNAANLPLEPEALAARLGAAAAVLAEHSPVPSLLLMNGSDHVEPQAGLPAALEAAEPLLGGARVEIGTLEGFVERVRAEAPEALPLHLGELRSGLRSPLLQGCASARLPQKRADFENDRLLVRYLEPLAAWLGALGGDPDTGIIEHAWRIALENHPHDSICGCSIDAVHAEMDVRFARVRQIASAHLARVAADLAARVVAPEGRGALLLAWNPHGQGRGHAAGEIELDSVGEGRRAPLLHLRAADGSRLPVRAEILAPGAQLADYRMPARIAAALVRGFPNEFTGLYARDARMRRVHGALEAEVLLGSAVASADAFAARREALAQALEAEGDEPVRYRVRRLPRVGIECVDALPGCGLRVYRVARGRAGARGPAAGRTAEGGAFLESSSWRIDVGPDGRVSWRHAASALEVDDALRIVSEGDRGDEYDFDPVDGDPGIARPDRVRVRLLPASEAEVGLVIESLYRLPVSLGSDRRSRSARRVPLRVRTELRLWEGLDRVDCSVDLSNTVRDHRLRVQLRAPFRAERLEVESAFEAAERPIAPPPDAFGSERPAQLPAGACPQRSFATLSEGTRAFTVANRGAAEVEPLRDPAGDWLAVTLLRAVGWLSREDLVMRPGHAGPALETPGAQVPGPHRVELSWRLHAQGAPDRSAEAHRFAAPALLFAGASEGPGSVTDEARLLEVADGARLLEVDDPEVVISALEPLADGGIQVRLYDVAGRARRVRLRWNASGTLRPVDLAGRPDASTRLEADADGGLVLDLGASRIVTLHAS